jgi:hypothetical protein
MNIQELIDQLTDLKESYGDDIEVRIASQPSWPFEHDISQVEMVDFSEGEQCGYCGGSGRDEEEECPECEGSGTVKDPDETGKVIYLGEGLQIGYLPSQATEALGWKEGRH